MSLEPNVCKQCVVCRKAAARTDQQSMGQLPSSRITPWHGCPGCSYPEAVSDLNSEAFISALKGFISRREKPSLILLTMEQILLEPIDLAMQYLQYFLQKGHASMIELVLTRKMLDIRLPTKILSHLGLPSSQCITIVESVHTCTWSSVMLKASRT